MTKNEIISIENNLKTQHTLHISNTQNIISHSFSSHWFTFYVSTNLWIWLYFWMELFLCRRVRGWIELMTLNRNQLTPIFIYSNIFLFSFSKYSVPFSISRYRFGFWRLKSIFMQFTTKEIFPGRVIAHLNTRHNANCENTVNDFDTMNQQNELHINATWEQCHRIDPNRHLIVNNAAISP